MFFVSTIGYFIKSYVSVYGDPTKAKVIELAADDVETIGRFLVLAGLLLLYHH